MAIYKKVSGDIVKVAGYGDIADNLTTLSPVMSLSAKQGNVLNTNKAERTDISSIITTGTKNTTGAQITSGTYFYLNGELVKAKSNIAVNADYTLNTNYEVATVGGVLTELNSNLNDSHFVTVLDLPISNSFSINANSAANYTVSSDDYYGYNLLASIPYTSSADVGGYQLGENNVITFRNFTNSSWTGSVGVKLIVSK